MKLEKKIILYVRSSRIDTLGVVAREAGTFGTQEWAQAWKPSLDQKDGKYFHDRYYSDADWEALMIAKKFHENTDVEIEVVDISKHVTQRIKLLLKGSIATPQFVLNGKKLPQIANVVHLTSFLK